MDQQRLRLRPAGLDWREVDGEVVALDTPAERYLAANRTGSVLWAALADGTTRDELVALLLDSYEIDRATAEHDVDDFLTELRRHGLLDEATA
jgi:hypothetical protein